MNPRYGRALTREELFARMSTKPKPKALKPDKAAKIEAAALAVANHTRVIDLRNYAR